jgi:hypothetical protein
MTTNQERAARLLKHYFRLIAQKSGIKWDSDNDSEIEQIVEAILDAASEKTDEAISDHNSAQISHKI